MKSTDLSRRAFLQIAVLSAGCAVTGRVPPEQRAPAERTPSARPQRAERQWRVTGSDVKAFADFDRTFQAFMQRRNVPGAGFALAYRGRLVFARGYTWSADPDDTVTPSSLFRVASVSKPITSAAVMHLVQSGRLKLADELVARVPMSPPEGARADARLAGVTVRDLLQHTGGWNRDEPPGAFDPMFIDRRVAKAFGVPLPITREQIIDYMGGQALQFAPGAQQSYSNFGYCLLGRVIEHATGQRYADYVRANVLEPLGIRDMRLGRSLLADRAPGEVRYSTADGQEHPSVLSEGARVPLPYGTFNLENLDAHGGWIASCVDLARFAASFTRSSHPFLDASSLELLYGVPKAGRRAPRGQRYGCWSVQTTPGNVQWRWHDGSLPGTLSLIAQRSDGPAWVFLLNQRDDASDPSGASYGALSKALDALVSNVARWPDHDLFV